MTHRRIDVRTDEGTIDVHLHTPPGEGAWPLVLLYMDAFGIRPALMSMADRLAAAGYAVAVPNLYYRHGAYPPFDPHAVAAEGPEKVRFRSMIASLDHEMVMRDTRAVLAALDGATGVRPGAAAALGYCMGGGFALSAAGTFSDRFVLAASFHGGSLATDRPDSPHRLAAQIRGFVHVGAAEIDPTFDSAQAQRLRDAFDAAGVRYSFEVHQGAKHGFAVTNHLAYDRAASERHWTVLTDLLRTHLAASSASPAVAADAD